MPEGRGRNKPEKCAEQAQSFPTCCSETTRTTTSTAAVWAVTGLQKLPPGYVSDGSLYSYRSMPGAYAKAGEARGGSIFDRLKNLPTREHQPAVYRAPRDGRRPARERCRSH